MRLSELKMLFKDSASVLKILKREHWNIFFQDLTVVLGLALLPFATNYGIAAIVTTLTAKQGWPVYGMIFVAVSLLAIAILSKFRNYLLIKIDIIFDQHVSSAIQVAMPKIDIVKHEDREISNLRRRCGGSVGWRVPYFFDLLSQISQNLVQLIAATVVVAFLNPIIGLVMFIFTLPKFWMELVAGQRSYDNEKARSEPERKLWHLYWGFLEAEQLLDIQVFQNGAYLNKRTGELRKYIRDIYLETEWGNLLRILAISFLPQMATIAAVIYLIDSVSKGEVAAGELAFYLGALLTYEIALGAITRNLAEQFKNCKFLQDLNKLFSLVENKPAMQLASISELKDLSIQLENVSYKVGNKTILDNINLTIPFGAKIGLVGRNGAGKTTLIKLISGFYQPTTGRISVGGIDLNQVNLEEWRRLLAILFQDYTHYRELTIGEAIEMGVPEWNGEQKQINWELIEEATSRAKANFIKDLPHTYATYGDSSYEPGVKMSGGQRQTLALARAHRRSPKIMILDEPTAAIDGYTESQIFQDLLSNQEQAEVTRILITHRYYSIRHCEKVIVMEQGRIVEEGSHQELMQLNGIYAEEFRSEVERYQMH